MNSANSGLSTLHNSNKICMRNPAIKILHSTRTLSKMNHRWLIIIIETIFSPKIIITAKLYCNNCIDDGENDHLTWKQIISAKYNSSSLFDPSASGNKHYCSNPNQCWTTTIRHYSHYSYYSLFAIRHYSLFAIHDYSLFAIRYSRLFAICDYSLFAIRVFQTPVDQGFMGC